jgi:hypothetical protein
LSFNTSYVWRVRVWDEEEAASGLRQGSFSTKLNAYPLAIFSWSPPYPSTGETVQFCSIYEDGVCDRDYSYFYDGSENNSRSWAWDIYNKDGQIVETSDSRNISYIFEEENLTGYRVDLTVIDASGYSCSTSSATSVRKPLPKWWETTPLFK